MSVKRHIKQQYKSMAIETPPENSVEPQADLRKPSTPLRCFTGALISGSLAIALYKLTASIAGTFASKPVPTGNVTTTNIAVAVRTLVVGMSMLATAIFAISALGLVALGIQLLIRQLWRSSADSE
jgi:Protein of unknown function (DUF3082)